MQALLEALDLTAYQARALQHLLRHGPRAGPDLARETDVPYGRVYDTLNALAQRGLVLVTPGRPKTYAAAAPDVLQARLQAAARRRVQELGERLDARVHDLGEQLQRLAPKPEPGAHAYGVRLGEESGREFLIEATHEAARDVVAALPFDRIQDDDLRLFDAFRAAVGRGLRTRILLRRDDIDYLLTTPYVDDVLDAMLPHLGQNLDVRLTWQSPPPFAAIDGRRVMLGVKNPLDETVYFAVIHVEDEAFAEGITAKFDALWATAQEPRELVQWALGKRGGRAMARLGARLLGGRGSEPSP
jgi:sugar-specific transcriptional regulator TrmB